MNYQKILLSTLGGAVVMFLLGWAIWGFALFSIYSASEIQYDGLRPEMPNMLMMSLSMVATALLWSIIYHKWASIKTFATGAKAGALIAVLAGLGTDLMMMSSLNLHEGYTVFFCNILGNLIWGAISGGVIGWILGRGE